MNKKGFTLVELLAVIVVIGIISTIAVISMNGIRNKVDLKMVEGNINLILTSARQYGEQDLNGLSTKPIGINVASLKAITELDIEEAYDNFEITVYLKNRRATACISNSDELAKIVGNDNVDSFSSYICGDDVPTASLSLIGDVNNDKKVNCDDVSALSRYVSGYEVRIMEANADLNNDHSINEIDVKELNRIVKDVYGLDCKK